MVYIILGKGFEEAEALIPCDLLRRAGVEVRLAGIGGRQITGGHGITVVADCIAEETELAQANMLVLPGGLGGVASIQGCEKVLTALKAVYERGGFLAAICAAPSVLDALGILKGKRATCYPGIELKEGILCEDGAVRDDRIITGKAAGTSFDFALELITALCGAEKAQEIAHQVVYR